MLMLKNQDKETYKGIKKRIKLTFFKRETKREREREKEQVLYQPTKHLLAQSQQQKKSKRCEIC